MFVKNSEVTEDFVPAVSLGRRIGVSLVGIMLIGFISLLGIQSWFDGRIVAGVSVAHVELSGLTVDQARQRLNELESSRSVSFVVAGKRYQPSLSDIGAHYDTETVLSRAYLAGRESIAAHPRSVDIALDPVIDSARLAAYLAPITQIGTAPVDARLEVRKGEIAVVPDTPGFSINKGTLEKALRETLTTFHADEPEIAPEPLAATIRTADLSEAQASAQALMATSVIMSDGATTISAASNDIASWLSFAVDPATGKTAVRVDQSKVDAYVAGLAKRLDNPAIDRKVDNINGTSTVVSEGKDGDGIDRDPIVAVLSKLTAGVPISIAITRHVVAFQTRTTFLSDISSGKYIEINLSQQHLWVWENHEVIYDSPLTSGAIGAGLGTVTGTFHIYYKNTNTHLVGRDYDVPVKFWMPFYLGYGLHDAVWRNGNFGGQDYIYGGSHGCVNLPDATAAWLYGWSVIGTTVYIHK